MNLINSFQEHYTAAIESINTVRLILLLLGCYSITRLVVTDTFPLFANPREWLWKRFPPTDRVTEVKPPRGVWKKLPDNKHYVVIKGHWLGDLTDCPWCAGFWVSLSVWTAYAWLPLLTLAILIPFAFRAFVGGYANKVGGG